MRLGEVENYAQLEEVIAKANWQKFEEIVGKVFKLNGYEVEINKVITFKRTKRQYDVIAKRGNDLIVVDCKKWNKKRRKSSGLRQAVKAHIKRTRMLDSKEDKYPLIVLSCKTLMKIYREVPILSIPKLNNFLLDFERNKERILKV